jgi:hypothetical protein
MQTVDEVQRSNGVAAMPQAPAIRPSTRWYWAGALVAILSLVVGAIWAIAAYSSYKDDIAAFARIPTPGQGSFVVDAPGERTLYVETTASEPTANATDIRVTAPDGSTVGVQPYGIDLQYDAPDGSVGHAVGTIEVVTPGTYQVSTQIAGGTLAVGDGISGSIIAAVVASIVLVFAGFVAGVVIVIVTAVRRSSAKAGSYRRYA